jgi:hypothetical protein
MLAVKDKQAANTKDETMKAATGYNATGTCQVIRVCDQAAIYRGTMSQCLEVIRDNEGPYKAVKQIPPRFYVYSMPAKMAVYRNW